MKIADYDYPLPDHRIAKFPLKERDSSKLLVYCGGELSTDVFRNLGDHLPSNSLMVFNNTRVIQARLHFNKISGALIEVFLLEPFLPADYEQVFQAKGKCSWLCLIGNQKKWKEGTLEATINGNNSPTAIQARREGTHGNSQIVEFTWDNSAISFADILDAMGELPIPPYLNRKTEESDKTTYQTVYSKIKGSVAAPTAGLHFTERVIDDLQQRGIARTELTLHVGAGTFRPVKSEEIADHDMHAEFFVVKRQTLESLLQHLGSIVAVGTTSVRTLESLYYIGSQLLRKKEPNHRLFHVAQWEPYGDNAPTIPAEDAIKAILRHMDDSHLTEICASTQIIIVPGYQFKLVNMLVTNFHQPKSTLLLLVSAFVNGNWKEIYDYALHNNYRFLSYGDSSLLIP